MSHPQYSSIPPGFSGQSKTLFFVHPPKPGPTTAVIVTASSGGMRARERRFKDAHAALDWSIEHRAQACFTHPAPDVTGN